MRIISSFSNLALCKYIIILFNYYEFTTTLNNICQYENKIKFRDRQELKTILLEAYFEHHVN